MINIFQQLKSKNKENLFSNDALHTMHTQTELLTLQGAVSVEPRDHRTTLIKPKSMLDTHLPAAGL